MTIVAALVSVLSKYSAFFVQHSTENALLDSGNHRFGGLAGVEILKFNSISIFLIKNCVTASVLAVQMKHPIPSDVAHAIISGDQSASLVEP